MSTQTAKSGSDSGVKSLAWWRFIPWVVSVCFLLGLLWWRFGAQVSDFGLQNVLSYIMAIAVWGFAVLGAMLTSRRIIWLSLLLIPVLLIGGFLAFFRVVRVDAEIVPQFAWRWSETAALPDAEPASDSPVDAFFAPRSTDYPQFLGPDANSTMLNTHVETNWKEHEPKILWKQPIGKGWSGFAVQGDAAYTMEQREQEEWVSCYDANTGKLLWHYAIPGLHFNPLGGTGPRTTPVIFEGRVYAMSAVSNFVCLDMRTGEKVWSIDLLDLVGATQEAFESSVMWGRSGSPLIVDGKVIIPLGGTGASMKSLIALDAKTGAEVWRAGDDQISYSTPTIVTLQGQRQILYVSEAKLNAFAIADGKDLWQVPWPSSSRSDANVSQPIALDDTRVLMTKGYGGGGQVIEVKLADGAWSTNSLWKIEAVLRTKFTSCVIKDGNAFGLNDGILECVDLSNGKRLWKKGRYRHGQVLLVGDELLITAENGSLVLVAADPNEFRELATMPVIGDVTWNTAALSGDRLLMRNSDEAACVILPLKSASSTTSSSDAAPETAPAETPSTPE